MHVDTIATFRDLPVGGRILSRLCAMVEAGLAALYHGPVPGPDPETPDEEEVRCYVTLASAIHF